jgi:hypothetical protein
MPMTVVRVSLMEILDERLDRRWRVPTETASPGHRQGRYRSTACFTIEEAMMHRDHDAEASF